MGRCGNLLAAGLDGAMWEPASGRARRPGEWKLCGGFPPFESSPEEGIPEPFPSPARCPSFNTGLISFLLPAQRCQWEHRNGPCPGGGGHPRAKCHEQKRPLSWALEPHEGLHAVGKGLNSLQGQPGRVRWRLPGVGPRSLRLSGRVAS